MPFLRDVSWVVVNNDRGDKLRRDDGAAGIDHNPPKGVYEAARIALVYC